MTTHYELTGGLLPLHFGPFHASHVASVGPPRRQLRQDERLIEFRWRDGLIDSAAVTLVRARLPEVWFRRAEPRKESGPSCRPLTLRGTTHTFELREYRTRELSEWECTSKFHYEEH